MQHGLIAGGLGAFDSLRLEKGYRLWGQDLSTEHDPFEAGLGFAVKMDKAFQGWDALRAKQERGPTERLSCIVLADPDAVVMGKEPIWAGGRVVSYVTSANYGYSIGRGIAYGYLPLELADQGTTVLMVEQNAHLALKMADRAYVMETGRIVLSGSARELLTDDHVRRAYLGG